MLCQPKLCEGWATDAGRHSNPQPLKPVILLSPVIQINHLNNFNPFSFYLFPFTFISVKHLFLISLCFLSIFPALRSQDAQYLPPVEFDINYKTEVFAVIIDARIARQYRRSRIPAAVGIEKMARLEVFADTMDTETPLYIYCDGESRSRTVEGYLAEQGFTQLYILKGGIREWQAAGLPIDKKRLRKSE